MKKEYRKPFIYLESIRMDHPSALACQADEDDMHALISLGYFTEDMNCEFFYRDDMLDGSGNDTICYHSNVQAAFLS